MKVKSTSAKIGDWIFVLICVLISIICVVPMINLLAKSLSSTDYLVKNAVSLWPKGFNLDAYKTVLSDPKYIRAFFWTVFLTVVCTLVSLTMTEGRECFLWASLLSYCPQPSVSPNSP